MRLLKAFGARWTYKQLVRLPLEAILAGRKYKIRKVLQQTAPTGSASERARCVFLRGRIGAPSYYKKGTLLFILLDRPDHMFGKNCLYAFM